ncbi:MAG: hypothetical protein SynsKO_28740 [Synoicihabitans sp.]
MMRKIWWIWLMGLATGLAANERPDVVELVVEGTAAANVPNAAAAVKSDAMRRALEEVAGRQVRSYALTASNQMVASYTFAKVEGMVERADPVGPLEQVSGVWLQRFRIAVRSGELNRELVAEGIDVEFLYETVSRPRIAIAIREQWQSEVEGPWATRPGSFSVARIGEYFKSRHPDFDIRDLDLMRRDSTEEVDYVREANANRFDYLIVGETRLSRRPLPAAGKNPWAMRVGDPEAGQERHAFAAELEWRVVEVASARTVFTVQDRVEPDPRELREVASRESAAAWAGEQVVDARAPELFRRMLAQWNRQVFNQAWEIILRGSQLDLLAIDGQLRERSGLESASISMRGASRGEAIFSARSSMGANEQVAEVAAALGEGYVMVDMRPGRMVFERVGAIASAPGVLVRLEGVGFTESRAITTALGKVSGVQRVESAGMRGGVREIRVVGSADPEDLAIAAEGAAPGRVRVMDLSDTQIVIQAEESR